MTEKQLLYHLIWMIDQYCGYGIEDDNTPLTTRYNADARAVTDLINEGYAFLVSNKMFPATKFMEFKWTEKGLEVLNSEL